MPVNDIEIVKKVIKITQIDSPHKFWYKYCNDAVQDRLINKLEREITDYANELLARTDPLPTLREGDVVAVHHYDWHKWIRGKSGRLKMAKKDSEVDSIYIWAIDYGCKLLVPLHQVLPLTDVDLAYRRPINVHIGGLSNIVPATIDFDEVLFDTVKKKSGAWSKNATEIFTEWIGEQPTAIFVIQLIESSRCFGQVIIDCNGNEPFSIVDALCQQNEAMLDKNYMNDVKILDKDDFFRLNHEMTMPRAEGQIDEMAEYIWMNDDDPMAFNDTQIDIPSSLDETPTRNQQQSQSGTHGNSALTGHSMSTVSMTLSVKSLNKYNVLAITDNIVDPSKEWKDTFYFKDNVQAFVKRWYQNQLDPVCSYGWPHIMRGNSLLMIGKRYRNVMLVLPTFCTIVYRARINMNFSSEQRVVNDWITSVRIEPIGIIFVSGAEKVEPMAIICRKFLEKCGMGIVNVTCFNSAFEIDALVEMDQIDILVMPVFCFSTLVSRMPKLFTSNRLQYAWFDEIDKMCQINQSETYNAMDMLCAQDLDMQVAATTQVYHPILHELYDRIKIPMMLIGDKTPFEAALCADCFFVTEFVAPDTKIKDLIEKLLDRHSKMTGSIAIICSNLSEVKYVTGCLTQSNIKCTDFDRLFSLNQLKLVNWTEQSISVDTSPSYRNILVCEDGNLDLYPIRTANHIVHYSLPNDLQTFLYRFITCFGYYAEKLERDLLNKPNRYELARPISVTYFDDNVCDEFIQIYELLANRTQSEIPPLLMEAAQEIKQKIEIMKGNKPLCIQMITRAKDCDVSCPYRHTNTNDDYTYIPEYGFVNMELIEILAPNHFTVRVIGHKRRLQHKSKSIANFDVEIKDMEKKLREYYSIDGSREELDQIKTGEMYLCFYQKRPKRCRVVSKSKKYIQIYLIDDGKMRQCKEEELYALDEDFKEFPARVIEIFVLGYAPNDNNTKWLPEATKLVQNLMSSLKERDRKDSYLQAEVLRSFDRRLIVKDLKILYKVQNQLQGKLIASSLIKFRMATKAPIVLHDVFMATPDSSEIKSQTTTYTKSATHDDIGLTSQTGFAVQSNISEFASVDSLAFDSMGNQILNILAAPANSTVSLIDIPKHKDCSEMFIEHDLTKSYGSMTEVIQPAAVVSIPSVDEIFGSLPENIQATEVLSPIKCDSYQIDETDNVKEEENQDNWLIKFSDSDDDEKEDNKVEPSPFAYVRLINSYDDL